MLEDGNEVSETASPPIVKRLTLRPLLEWIGVILSALAILSIIVTKSLPHTLGMAVSTILQNAMVIVFIVALPVLEIILWKLAKDLPQKGYWGYLLLVVGLGPMLPSMATYVVIDTFMAQPLQSSIFAMVSLLVLCGGFVIVSVGLLIVFVQLVRDIVQLFRDSRQPRLGDGQ